LEFWANYADYLNGRYPPGEYFVTFTGTALGNSQYTHTVEVKMTLSDPCDPPKVFRVKPNIAPKTIKSFEEVNVPLTSLFEIKPEICPFITLLAAANTERMLPDSVMTPDFMTNSVTITNYDQPTVAGPDDKYQLIVIAETNPLYGENSISTTARVDLFFI